MPPCKLSYLVGTCIMIAAVQDICFRACPPTLGVVLAFACARLSMCVPACEDAL